jgi:hypothetical protein
MDISRTYFAPNLQATLAEVIYRLGGTNKVSYRGIPQTYVQNTGFAAHLQLLHILLRADLTGGIENTALQVVKYNYNRSPQNPLFAYAYHRYVDGDQTETQDILLIETLFPNNRLPTSHDRCEPWLSQRDGGKDWEPCDLDKEARIHSGGDFLFVAYLLNKS